MQKKKKSKIKIFGKLSNNRIIHRHSHRHSKNFVLFCTVTDGTALWGSVSVKIM